MSTSNVIAATIGTTATPLGRAGGYITATVNPGVNNPLIITTVTVSSNITESLATTGLVSLVAGRTYRISAGVRVEPPVIGFGLWYIRTSTGTNISDVFSNESLNTNTNNGPLSSTTILYTAPADQDIGMYLDALSSIGETGPGSYLVVEEIPSTTFVSGAETTITNNNGTVGQVLSTNADGTSTWTNGGLVSINAQTGTAYTLALSDSGALVDMNNAAANTLTVPLNATVAFPVGTSIAVSMGGAGTTTLAGAVGVTINSAGGLLGISAQYATVSLLKTATDTWLLVGSLA